MCRQASQIDMIIKVGRERNFRPFLLKIFASSSHRCQRNSQGSATIRLSIQNGGSINENTKNCR